MVYTGKPSRGCAVCRKRHIKCDETEPSCTFCTKRNIPCPGYKSQFDVAWKDQNMVAERSVQRRKNATKKLDSGATPRLEVVKLEVVKQQSPGPLDCLSQDLEAYALDFFLSKYLLLPCDLEVGGGFLDCVYPAWERASYDSPLRSAVLAVASCMLEAWSHIVPGQPLSFSEMQFAKAISAMRKYLQSSDAIGDDVILSALMLDFYEGVKTFTKQKINKSPHMSGTMALVAQRRSVQGNPNATQQVLIGARRQILSRALRDKKYMTSAASKLANTGQPMRRTVGLRLDDLNIEVANLQAVACQVGEYEQAQDILLWNLLEQAVRLDQELSVWYSTIPVHWLPIKVSGPTCIAPSICQAGLYHDYCNIYESIHIANRLNEYCCSRIKLQLIIHSCLAEIDSRNCESTAVLASDVIQEFADMICDSVPYHLGDRTARHRIDDRTALFPHLEGVPVPDDHYAAAAATGGFTLVARLMELMTIKVPLRDGQRQWIGGQLARIGRIHTPG